MSTSSTPDTLHILVVEDGIDFAPPLCDGLRTLGHTVDHAPNLSAAEKILAQASIQLVLLDLEVAEQDGLSLLKKIRTEGTGIPVLIMTGSRLSNRETVEGLNLGADDYLHKPFGFDVLNARLNAVLRRTRQKNPGRLGAGDLVINRVERQVLCKGKAIDMSNREQDLLAALLETPGEVIRREALLERVWADTPNAVTLNNTLDVHISKLRKKLKAATSQSRIETVWGCGFILVAGE